MLLNVFITEANAMQNFLKFNKSLLFKLNAFT